MRVYTILVNFRYKIPLIFRLKYILILNVILVVLCFLESLKKYMPSLRQALINPVEVSQLLYSERCINETTLDKVESIEGSLYDKKTLVLEALEAVSADYEKFKVFLTMLSKFDETRSLAESIQSDYGEFSTFLLLNFTIHCLQTS